MTTLRDLLRPVFVLASVSTCGCGALAVSDKPNGGVPFYPSTSAITVTTSGVDESGMATQEAPAAVSIETRADYSRPIYVTNKPAPFATGAFTVSLRTDGRLESITGKSEEQAGQAIKTGLSLITSAASVLRMSTAELQTELNAQKAALTLLLQKLAAEQDVTKIKTIQEAIQNSRTRIDEINSILNAKTKGSAPSKTVSPPVEVLKITDDAFVKSQGLAAGELKIYLIPVAP